MRELSGWVAGVQLIGEFDALPIEQINQLVQECGLHAVLLHRRHPADELAALTVPALRFITWIPDMVHEDVELLLREQAPFTRASCWPLRLPPAQSGGGNPAN
ncbi:hypothetical protein MUN84_00335 [Hymenobacter sp. 5516J-16]|uniref:hypothetical protein n=1 Tax=Hymenobacter sp. 5516J-16 TaxID=2932253 RepID=UPI001FD5426F|nr:hypothetical protein [Hymenobacter sp. 5516J-16]UOQ77228.1 hypothetical protein MUN84_00335 [Hymenobacter sp. 5516J-16]